MSEISSATLPREPRLHVAVIGALGIGDRQHEARRAVEEAELEQIDAQERPDAVRDTAERGNLAARDSELLSAERGILIDAADRIFQPGHRIVQERLLEPRHGAVAYDPLVH